MVQWKNETIEVSQEQIMAEMAAHRRAIKQTQDAGIPALTRLFEVARRDYGQSRHIAAFLLGLYNGRRFPFDLTDLRCIDKDLFDDCMRVLAMDRTPQMEVHCYFEDGGQKFEDLAKFHGIKNASERYKN